MTQVLDTNVLVRLLTADDEHQFERSKQLFANTTEPFLVLESVLMETAWVLRSAYGFESSDIADALSALINLPEVRTEKPDRLHRALEFIRDGMDVGDAFHVAAVPDGARFITFDRRLVAYAAETGTKIDLL